MNPEKLTWKLEQNGRTFQAILEGYSDKDEIVRWKQKPEKWSLLEILCHLVDEEREDFRTRVQFALENASGQPPPIDPQGWVKSRNYIDQNYTDKLQEFMNERNRTLQWLKNLHDANWNSSFTHSKFGKFTAFYLLTNWVAHDYLHIKQITRLKYDYLIFISGENSSYAGEWK